MLLGRGWLQKSLEASWPRKDDPHLLAQAEPGLVTWLPFRQQDGHDPPPIDGERLPVAEHLSEAKAELLLLVCLGRALYLRYEDGVGRLPGKVAFGLSVCWRTGNDAGSAEEISERVLRVRVSLVAAVHTIGIYIEGFTLS